LTAKIKQLDFVFVGGIHLHKLMKSKCNFLNPAMALLPFIQNDIYLPIYSEHFDFLCIQFSQMNDILGEDYEKKMATVSVLKQYAEDRDVEMLGRALKAILKTPQQKKIMKQIR
jgi:hypothetical protein